MKVLLTGASGQLGREFSALAPSNVELAGLPRSELDIGDGAAVDRVVNQLHPGIIVNAAACTAVDRAEQEPEQAQRVNADGAGYLARAAARIGARMIHVSTDFVFPGTAGRPYEPGDGTGPVNVYGRSKLAGEQRVLEEAPASSVIVRTAWVYSRYGRNFVKSMLKLMRTRAELRIVCDQVGSPTWARGLAQALWEILERPEIRGIHHWTDAGVASWYDFACAVLEEGLHAGLLANEVRIIPIASAEYPAPAQRPAYSVMDKSATWALLGGPAPHWRRSLRAMLAELDGDEI